MDKGVSAMTRSTRFAAFATAAVVAFSLAGAANAADPYKAPRNGFGQPDLSGTWTNASVTQRSISGGCGPAPVSWSCQMVRMQARPSSAWAATSAQLARCNARHPRAFTQGQPRQAPSGITAKPSTLKAITRRWTASVSSPARAGLMANSVRPCAICGKLHADGPMRFLCDEMLLRLARLLRAAGYDTYLASGGEPDAALLKLAREEGRMLITRDKRLASIAAREA